MQLLAAAWLGFAALDWLSRGTVLGGIYGRPLVVANFGHLLIVSIVFGRATLEGGSGAAAWIVLASFAMLTAAYTQRMFGGPSASELPKPKERFD
jgi:hypothetical protein